MRKIILLIMQSRIYRWFIKDVLPFIRFSTQPNKITGKQYHRAYENLKPGHIILCVDDRKASSFLIPGIMSHAEICISKQSFFLGYAPEIAGMTHSDFTYSDYFDTCKDSSRVVVLECLDWSQDYIKEVIKAVHSLKDSKYDVEFLLGVEALYCSELIYMADQLAAYRLGILPKLKVDLSDLVGLGRPYLSPDGLLFADNVRCVWDSDNEFKGLSGPEIEELINAKRV